MKHCYFILIVLIAFLCMSNANAASVVIRHLAGSSQAGDGLSYPATTLPIFKPHGFGLASNGNLYFVEMSSENIFDKEHLKGRIRCVHSSNKTITTILSNLDNPQSLVIDSQDNIYFSMAHSIKKLSPSGQLTIVAGTDIAGDSPSGTLATQAKLKFPSQIWLNSNSDLFIADTGNNKIKKVSGGVMTTIAGTNDFTSPTSDGLLATSVMIQSPYAVTVTSSGLIYFNSLNSKGVKRIELNGKITTIPLSYPDGEEPINFRDANEYSRTYASPHMFAVGETVYYGEQRFDASGSSKWFAGSAQDSGLADVKLGIPYSMIVKTSEIYFSQNYRISKIDLKTRAVTQLAGYGEVSFFGNQIKAGDALFSTELSPLKLHVDSNGIVYILDSSNNRIRKVQNGTITTVVGNGQNSNDETTMYGPSASIQYPLYMLTDKNNELFFTSGILHGILNKVASNGVMYHDAGVILMPDPVSNLANNASESFMNAASFVNLPNNDMLIMAMNVIRYYDRKKHTLDYVSTDGTVEFFEPPSLCAIGTSVIMADSVGNRILKLSTDSIPYKTTVLAGTGVAGFCGDGGLASKACLNFPSSVACAPNGDIYLVDSENNRIRRIVNSTGVIETIVGNGVRGFSTLGALPKSSPLRGDRAYVAIDPRNSRLYFSEPGQVRYLDSGFTCFGIDSSNQTVCSGNGHCIGVDVCNCMDGYTGTKCSVVVTKPVTSSVKPVASSSSSKPVVSVVNPRANNSTSVLSVGNQLRLDVVLIVIVCSMLLKFC